MTTNFAGQPSSGIPPAIDPRHHQPALELPQGQTYEGLLRTLTSFTIHADESAVDSASTGGELATYVNEDYERFLRTLSLVPPGPLDLLEIGANPYFMTYLLKKFRREARLSLANSFGGAQEQRLTGPSMSE